MLHTATHLLCTELVYRPVGYLASRDPSLFTDDLTWTTNGGCFMDFEKNGIQDGGMRVLAQAHADPHAKILAPDTSPHPFSLTGKRRCSAPVASADITSSTKPPS